MRAPCLILLSLAFGTLPVRAEELPQFEIEFRPSAGAQALQNFVGKAYAAEAEAPAYAGFTVTLKPGVDQLKLPGAFTGTLLDLVVAAGCLSNATPVGFAPAGVTFVPAVEPAPAECRRWTAPASAQPVQEKTP